MSNTNLQQETSIKGLKETLKEFSALAATLNSVTDIDKGSLSLEKMPIPDKGREAIRLCLWDKIKEACHVDLYEDIHRLIKLTHQSYDQFKGVISSQYSTHRYITEQAVQLIQADPAIAEKLLEYCTFPDEPKSDMSDLIFEGHFYGKTDAGGKGNFLGNLFPQGVAILEAIKKATYGLDEDIEEHAVMNFIRHYSQSGKSSPGNFYLGVAAHYLQDLTAPHHVGNFPAVPYVDHYFFEKFASLYIHGHPKFAITVDDYNNFKASLQSNPSSPDAFAKEIYSKATAFIPYIATALHEESPGTDGYFKLVDQEVDHYNNFLAAGVNPQWEKAINGAVPLAVYATAYLFEEALKPAAA